MPTYDYECKACGNKLEIFQKMNDKPLKTCPACHKDELKRLIGTMGLKAVSKVIALLLAAIAVHMIRRGLAGG